MGGANFFFFKARRGTSTQKLMKRGMWNKIGHSTHNFIKVQNFSVTENHYSSVTYHLREKTHTVLVVYTVHYKYLQEGNKASWAKLEFPCNTFTSFSSSYHAMSTFFRIFKNTFHHNINFTILIDNESKWWHWNEMRYQKGVHNKWFWYAFNSHSNNSLYREF